MRKKSSISLAFSSSSRRQSTMNDLHTSQKSQKSASSSVAAHIKAYK